MISLMSRSAIDDLLPLVATPSRYLGTETNAIHKDPRSIDLSVVLAFPDLYEIGMSHFGLQILYHLLNRNKRIVAERVFAPDVDMAGRLRSTGSPLPSLESKRPLGEFDIIGFSLLYELNYTNILSILELSNIPFSAAERADRHPLVVAGGPCTCNPEPVADLFDAMVIGDGEEVVVALTEAWLRWKDSGGRDRRDLLHQWSAIKGVYIPSLFDVSIDSSGYQRTQSRQPQYQGVRRAVVSELDDSQFPDRPIIPFGRPIHDRLRIELARGCTRGCRFCQAGMIYRPVRERSMQSALAIADRSIDSTGYEDLSLLSLSTGDYECIEPLMQRLMDRCAVERVAVSLPSLRVGTLTPELMGFIKRVRKTGFTIAPEAGSQRLRHVINKNIDEEEIVTTVQNAFDLGWQVIKLYFMIGLPTETKTDLQAIVDLIARLRRLKRPPKRKGRLNVSVATFIPKPHTPFQWLEQISLEEAQSRIRWLQERLRGPDIHFKWQDPRVSRMEGLWARGDRRLLPLLVTAYRMGCCFDGWTDHFQYDRWLAACNKTGIDIDSYVSRRRDREEPLPWDHIDSGVSKAYLWQEWKRALAGEATPDCRNGDCNDCGVCDWNDLAPRVHALCAQAQPAPDRRPTAADTQRNRYRLMFAKTGPARFFGHLEMVSLFTRAIRRAGISVVYSEGFHPKPKLRFSDALPLGIESRCEELLMTVADELSCRDLQGRLNAQLPEGLAVTQCREDEAGTGLRIPKVITYRVELAEGRFSADELGQFRQKKPYVINRTGRKGTTRQVDLCQVVDRIALSSADSLEISLRHANGAVLRPAEVLHAAFSLTAEQLCRARIVKTAVR
jgi:radical SAM family uncharacterized protein/radical SAM-linked protein